MLEYLRTWRQLKTDTRGVTSLEYALIAAVLVGVVTAAFTSLGGQLTTAFTDIGTKLTTQING